MNKTERDKFLTEARGECWHETKLEKCKHKCYIAFVGGASDYNYGYYRCSSCRKKVKLFNGNDANIIIPRVHKQECIKCGSKKNNLKIRIDFSTWEGFGKLREFYDGWGLNEKVVFETYILKQYASNSFSIVEKIIHAWHKDRLADFMCEFLKAKDV